MSFRPAIAAAALAALLPASGHALTFNSEEARLSVNAYADLQYTYMDGMPRVSGATIDVSDDTATLNQENLNLLASMERDSLAANINIHSSGAFQTGSDHTGATRSSGEFHIEEAFAQWQRSDAFAVRAGAFLAPFGLYNQIRYATGLFAPVVLATMYEPPPNYASAGGLDRLVPDRANLMATGTRAGERLTATYAAYVGSGERRADGNDQNKRLAGGARLTVTLAGQALGASAYFDEDDTAGAHAHYGADLDVGAGPARVQAEWLRVEGNRATNVVSYYARVSYLAGGATPFVGYDYLEDRSHPIYRDGMARWSAGVGQEVSANFLLKAEYHHHRFDSPAARNIGADRVHMVRLAGVLVF